MSDVTIRTNHQWRQFRYRDEVPKKVLLSEFDYQDDDVFNGYFKYRGCWYHLDQFMALASSEGPFTGWHGYSGDSYFSGTLIRVSDDGENYQVARYCQ